MPLGKIKRTKKLCASDNDAIENSVVSELILVGLRLRKKIIGLTFG